MPNASQHDDAPAPQQAIGQAIQRITAARLGRGFLPLAALAVMGVVELGVAGLDSRSGWILVAGSAATAAAMLAFGIRNVQLAFGRPLRAWMRAAMLASLVPPLFGFYVFAWRGLREVALGDGTTMRLAGVLLTALGLWALRSWMKLVEVQNLAQAMSLGSDEREGL